MNAHDLSEADRKFIKDLSYLIAARFCERYKLSAEAHTELAATIDEAVSTCVQLKLDVGNDD